MLSYKKVINKILEIHPGKLFYTKPRLNPVKEEKLRGWEW